MMMMVKTCIVPCTPTTAFPPERKPEERVDSDQRPSVTRNIYLQLHPLKRLRKVGIVALTRKLAIALWRFVEQGVVPEAATLKV